MEPRIVIENHNSLLDHHLSANAQCRKSVLEPRQDGFTLVDPFALGADIARIWRDAVSQSFHRVLCFLCKLSRQRLQ